MIYDMIIYTGMIQSQEDVYDTWYQVYYYYYPACHPTINDVQHE